MTLANITREHYIAPSHPEMYAWYTQCRDKLLEHSFHMNDGTYHIPAGRGELPIIVSLELGGPRKEGKAQLQYAQSDVNQAQLNYVRRILEGYGHYEKKELPSSSDS